MVLALALALSLSLAASAWAKGPMGPGGMGGPGMMNLTPEQAGKLFDLKEKFRTDTAGLRKDMMVKRLEMRELWKAETPDQNAILAKQKEINALRDQMSLKMVTFRLEAKKIAPKAGFGWGWGHHGMGMGGMGFGGGMGMGPGKMPPPPAAGM